MRSPTDMKASRQTLITRKDCWHTTRRRSEADETWFRSTDEDITKEKTRCQGRLCRRQTRCPSLRWCLKFIIIGSTHKDKHPDLPQGSVNKDHPGSPSEKLNLPIRRVIVTTPLIKALKRKWKKRTFSKNYRRWILSEWKKGILVDESTLRLVKGSSKDRASRHPNSSCDPKYTKTVKHADCVIAWVSSIGNKSLQKKKKKNRRCTGLLIIFITIDSKLSTW